MKIGLRRPGFAAVIVALTAGFYLLLIDTVSLPELYAGAGVVLLSVIAFELTRRQAVTEASLDPRWLRRGWLVLARVPENVVVLCWEAIAQLIKRRPSRGEFRAVPFRGGDGPLDRGRFATVELLGSLAPNTIVVGVDTDRELLLVHQLRVRGGRDELDPLRLG